MVGAASGDSGTVKEVRFLPNSVILFHFGKKWYWLLYETTCLNIAPAGRERYVLPVALMALRFVSVPVCMTTEGRMCCSAVPVLLWVENG